MLECAVGVDDCMGVGVGGGVYGSSVVSNVGACDASVRVTCGVNDET